MLYIGGATISSAGCTQPPMDAAPFSPASPLAVAREPRSVGALHISCGADGTYSAATGADGPWGAAALAGLSGVRNLDARVAMTTNAALRGVGIEEARAPAAAMLDDAPSTKFFVGALVAVGLFAFYRLLETHR